MIKKSLKSYPLTLTSIVVLSFLYSTAYAEESVKSEDEHVKSLDTIVVTGTRSLKRSKTESLQPIDVITAKDLVQRTGSTELATALSRIIPSINFPRPTVVDGTELVRPAQLKGLSPDQVLVLVNGKRRHTGAFINLGGTIGRGSAPTDLNAIPISAISRVEVLREGAAARYGSDAISGVINIILKSDPEHGEAGIKYGIHNKGDGEQKQTYISAGAHLQDQGYAVFTGEWQDSEETNRAGRDFRTVNGVQPTTYGQKTFRFGDPKSDELKLAINAGYTFSDLAELYGFTTYSHRKAETGSFYRLSNASNNIPAIYPNGFLPLIKGELDDVAAVAGVKGKIGEWNYDGSVNYGLNIYDIHTKTVNVDLYNDTGTTPLGFHNGKLKNQQTVVNADFSREIPIAQFASPLNLAFGAQYLNQRYQISAGDPESYYKSGSTGLGGFRDADAGKWSRDSYAAYIDLETNITEKFSASGAYRHEYYDDFGHTDNASLSLRYQVHPVFAVRGTASTGFRAPSLAQQYYAQTTSQLVNGVLTEAGTFPVNTPVAALLGAENLKAEKSQNLSVGFVFNPIDQLDITLDAYQIDIDDRISLSSNIDASTPAVSAYLNNNGITNTNFRTLRYFNNASDTRTRGIDLVANYQWDNLPYGQLTTSLAYNFNKNKVTKVKANPELLTALGVTRIDRREQYGLLAESTPEHKLSIGNDYEIGNVTINTNITRYGSFKTYSNNGPSQDQKFGAKWLLDLALSYKLKNWNFTIGGDNITDVYPDKDVYDIRNPTGGSLQYSQFSPFGFNGAYYYGKINYSW